MIKIMTTRVSRRSLLSMSVGAIAVLAALPISAQTLECPEAARMEVTGDIPLANMRIGVSVAYLEVPFYAISSSASKMERLSSGSPMTC